MVKPNGRLPAQPQLDQAEYTSKRLDAIDFLLSPSIRLLARVAFLAMDLGSAGHVRQSGEPDNLGEVEQRQVA
jgi:hypothetical protein